MTSISKISGNYLVISLNGKLDVIHTTNIEKEIDRQLQDHTDKNVILNLEDVEYMSSSGLRVFILIKRILNQTNRNLRLCNLSNDVRKLLEIVELIDLFDIYLNEEEALTE